MVNVSKAIRKVAKRTSKLRLDNIVFFSSPLNYKHVLVPEIIYQKNIIYVFGL
jgi:hypothetical protein